MRRLGELYPSHRNEELDYSPPPAFGLWERSSWAVCACVSALIIALQGQVAVSLGWLALMLVLGQVIMPPIYRCAHDWAANQKNLWLGVACGWALVPLPLHPVILMLTCVNPDYGLSPFTCGLLGLTIGPFFSAAQGLVIAGVVNIMVWLIWGKSLARMSA